RPSPAVGSDLVLRQRRTGGGRVCGPDVTAQLAAVLSQLPGWFFRFGPERRTEACGRLTSLEGITAGWDIPQLHFDSWLREFERLHGCASSGRGPDCHDTVTVDSGCYQTGGVNYVLFGQMWRLCSAHFARLR